MSRTIAVLTVLLSVAVDVHAQNPLRHLVDAVEVRYSTAQPVISYTLRVDSTDLSGFDVEMRIRNARDTVRLAMVAHPEYDDRYWRFVRDLRVEAVAGAGSAARHDSALWRVVIPGGAGVVRYRLDLPPAEGRFRSAWVPFLAPTGGLVGGPHSFLYVVGAELAPAHVTLDLPGGWEVATGLEPTADPRTFFAPSVDVLADCPILVGRLRSWRFAVDGVPHRVVYWPLPDAQPFDTAALVGGLERFARQAVALFGRAPYRDFTFQIQDGAVGGLEHANSVSIGAPSAQLAQGLTEFLAEATHEYFHTWNLMRIHPAGYGGVDYRMPARSRGLWWAEGITILYADLLRRRAQVPVFDSTRATHLEGAIARYLANPGNARFSAESVSVVAYGADPGALGDYSASTHLQGELLGTMLDFVVRDATGGRRSLDDVVRATLERFSGERGYTGADLERTVADVCGCAVRAFFDRYVRGANPIDFDRYLALIGLRSSVAWGPATGPDGRPVADLRVFAWASEGDHALRLRVWNLTSVWNRAGLHTGDRIVAVNGAPLAGMADFRRIFGSLRIGDTVRVEVARAGGVFGTTVVVSGYDRPTV
ncbi:MAG: PDZ domain-containing protein, partial [Gemmatimonadota bacterium]